MAQSPSHKFGQIIGDAIEAAIAPLLKGFADKHGLYLDGKGVRPARSGSKVTWVDLYGNAHDLDYVQFATTMATRLQPASKTRTRSSHF